jgi:hypothetical protein
VELCPQFVCDAAVFIGKFKGNVDKRRANGGFFVSVNHEPLPAALQFAKITGGEWFLRANLHFFSGDILNGTIFNNGDNTFTVETVLQVTSGVAMKSWLTFIWIIMSSLSQLLGFLAVVSKSLISDKQ